MGVGIVVTIVGLTTPDSAWGGRTTRAKRSKGIPTIYGIVAILAIVVLAIFVISRL